MNQLLVALSQYINPVMKQISLKHLYQAKNPIFCLETVSDIVFKYLVKCTNNYIKKNFESTKQLTTHGQNWFNL